MMMTMVMVMRMVIVMMMMVMMMVMSWLTSSAKSLEMRFWQNSPDGNFKAAFDIVRLREIYIGSFAIWKYIGSFADKGFASF